MPDPGYADNPPGCMLLIVGGVVLFILALIVQSCL